MSTETTTKRTAWVTGRDKDGTVLSRTGGEFLPDDFALGHPALLALAKHRDDMAAKNLTIDGQPIIVNFAVEVCVETTTVHTHYFPIEVTS